MIRTTILAGTTLLASACATHTPQPAVYPGSTTGILEYVNASEERHAISAQRCGEINQQTFVALGGDTTAAKIPAGESLRITMTIGCYNVFMGPDRMSLSGLSGRVDIQPEAEGFTRITSDGQSTFVKAD